MVVRGSVKDLTSAGDLNAAKSDCVDATCGGGDRFAFVGGVGAFRRTTRRCSMTVSFVGVVFKLCTFAVAFAFTLDFFVFFGFSSLSLNVCGADSVTWRIGDGDFILVGGVVQSAKLFNLQFY